ncbi:MAG: hypothetical protein IJD23_07860 [Spirochaetaceae bacterium]|nr:hypothetical protein [Spirochaetaceae bacterium]MBQ3025210.1 hypothetical protein [Spirochaetaceae bacterium]MBQ7904182.1 hypothetical protein [Spirochaetaceae bacterium]
MFIKKYFSAKGVLSDIKQEAEKIIIEINRETDNAITLMEAKISQVKDIIATAEKKVILYENTFIQKENEKQIYQQLTNYEKTNTPMQKAINVYKFNSSQNSVEDLSLFTENAGTSDFKNSEKLTSVNKKKKTDDQTLELDFNEKKEEITIIKKEQIEPKVSVQEQIIKLAKEGFTPELIASKLSVSINVVTMTIDLYL